MSSWKDMVIENNEYYPYTSMNLSSSSSSSTSLFKKKKVNPWIYWTSYHFFFLILQQSSNAHESEERSTITAELNREEYDFSFSSPFVFNERKILNSCSCYVVEMKGSGRHSQRWSIFPSSLSTTKCCLRYHSYKFILMVFQKARLDFYRRPASRVETYQQKVPQNSTSKNMEKIIQVTAFSYDMNIYREIFH